MLTDYYLQFDDFKSSVNESLTSVRHQLAENRTQIQRVSDISQDIIGFSENLVNAHINATMWAIDDVNEVSRGNSHRDITKMSTMTQEQIEERLAETQEYFQRAERRRTSKAGQRYEESVWQLKSCYKAYFFFIRAFQDASYGLLLQLKGNRPGRYSSMNDCISNQKQPIYNELSNINGYIDWFISFKAKRDRVKHGVNFSFSGPQWDIGISFTTVNSDGGVSVNCSEWSHKFRLGDLVQSLKHSTELIDYIGKAYSNSNK